MAENFDPTRLRDVHLVPLTPYDSAGKIDTELLKEHLTAMSQAGIRVFLPAAGTSEFHSLLADEIVEIVRATREASGPHASIFAPVGQQIDFAIEVGKKSLAAGADGVMFMPFGHPYLSDNGIRDYYDRVLEELECPALIYKKAALPSDELLLELAKRPQVVGIKYAENNLSRFRQTVLADGGKTEWLCGSAERFAPYFMLAGSPGYTTGAGNLCPRLTLAMHQAFTAGEYAEGMRFQELILPIEHYRAREGDSFNIAMLKHGMLIQGLDFGPPRAPGRKLTLEQETEIEKLLNPIFVAEQKLEDEMLIAGL